MMRVKDGTCSQVILVKYNRGYDTITEEQTGSKKRCLSEEKHPSCQDKTAVLNLKIICYLFRSHA